MSFLWLVGTYLHRQVLLLLWAGRRMNRTYAQGGVTVQDRIEE